MSIEFDQATNTPKFVYNKGHIPFAQQPPIVQEAILVVAGKAQKDIYAATQRAGGCGCRNCFRDLTEVKEWYQ